MNGIADMGGMDGLGRVVVEPGEPVFHADWERRTVTTHIAAALGGAWTSEDCRFARECMDPVEYLSRSYYEHWLAFLEHLMVAKELVTQEELAAGHLLTSTKGSNFIQRIEPGKAQTLFWHGGSIAMPTTRSSRFVEGQAVRARNINPKGHTRLPRYVRGKVGVVIRELGSFAFSDTRAHGLGDQPQHMYAVCFSAREVWGPDGGAKDTIILDMYEDYLEPVTE